MKAVKCRCGREPEQNKALLPQFRLSLHCSCGTEEIQFLVRSDSARRLQDNWRSLIEKQPFKHFVQHLNDPSENVRDYYPPEPMPDRRKYFHSGCC